VGRKVDNFNPELNDDLSSSMLNFVTGTFGFSCVRSVVWRFLSLY
jgi:hypothetical protein